MEQWLKDFSTALQIMEGHGLTEGFGHLSVRLRDGRIAITPAKGPGMSAANSLHILFSDTGERLDDGTLPAPLESPMHLAVYAARPDVNSICRTHSRYIVSYGVTGDELILSHGFGLMLGDKIPFCEFGDLISNEEKGNRVVQSLGANTALLLKGNGGFSVGDSISQAVVKAIYLEEAARISMDLKAASMNLAEWSESELESRRSWHQAEAARAWEYYSWKYRA
ncbi:class II aldolase/adducin family protein [Pelagicoccus albus]|uniref:Class II aldolase/adducin family protein n=1 Tax=Pelagicoccus albus TaxID=415222 RepID=A0A7X1EA43_9BACT|nr:class II aldolase/adducin family protein [Pelagicoccus albus]MBC2607878.1 class II aldolase/adducin family protein [Pelagicoccus albus]